MYKALYEENYSEKDIRELFRFLDWVLGLPEPLALEFKTFVNQYEEAQKMRYITSIERIGRQEGILQTSRENVIDILQVRFKRVPKALTQTIQQIDDTSFLSKLIKEAVLVDSLKTFKQQVENVAKS